MRSLCIFLPKLSAYGKAFVENKYISFLINNNKLLEKYEIWEIFSNSIKKELDSNLVYNKKILENQTKIM